MVTAKKAVVIFSGGADSITLLHWVKAQGYDNIYGLSFNYGQRHVKELQCAKYWGKKLCKDWKLINLNFMKDIANDSALTGKKKVPHDHYTHENQKITVVPNRNSVLLSIAVAWAENLKTSDVFYGAHASDRTIYPDCRKEFVEAFSKAEELGTFANVKIHAPFVDMLKTQVLTEGLKLGVDYSKTWSCYDPQRNGRPCMKCGTCQERSEGFRDNNVKDPLYTDREWKKALKVVENDK